MTNKCIRTSPNERLPGLCTVLTIHYNRPFRLVFTNGLICPFNKPCTLGVTILYLGLISKSVSNVRFSLRLFRVPGSGPLGGSQRQKFAKGNIIFERSNEDYVLFITSGQLQRLDVSNSKVSSLECYHHRDPP